MDTATRLKATPLSGLCINSHFGEWMWPKLTAEEELSRAETMALFVFDDLVQLTGDELLMGYKKET